MRKFILAAVALAFVVGAAANVLACDQGKTKAASASSSCAAKSSAVVLTGSGGSCSAKTGTANTGAGCSSSKGATAAGDGCPAGSMACCKDGEGKCANYVLTVADMDDSGTAKIEKALTGVKNVKAVYADAGSHKVWVCTGNAKLDSKAAVKSVQKAGFKQVKYAGVDSEHCVHEMKASAAVAKKAS